MRILPAILILTCLASSCQLAHFTEKPGVAVSAFPADMYGTYIHIEKSKGISDTHTLHITANGAKIDDPIIGRYTDLSDTNNRLSHLGDFYYLNVKEADSNALETSWLIYPFEYDSRHIYIYKLTLSKKNLKRMARCGLKPTGRRTGEYFMNNEAFKKYCEKYLRKKEAIKFTKIKK